MTTRQNTNHYGYKKDFRTALPQIAAVCIKNLLLLGYGMTLGFTTILIPAISEKREGEVFHLDSSQISWISSINYIAVPVGCALSGFVTTPIGRRRSMQLVNIPFFIAWVILRLSNKLWHLYCAFILTGLAGGLLEAPVLTYVAEITQPHIRGTLTASSSMSIMIGVFTQFFFGIFFPWRTVAFVNITFTILAVIALFFIPESPHWLVSRNRMEDAKKSLMWLRGCTQSDAIEAELIDIQSLYQLKTEESEDKETLINMLSHYTRRSFLVPYFLVSYSFFVGHFSGMTTLQTFAVSIFQMLEAPIDQYYATLISGILQITGSILCVMLVHYTGKRPLAFFSTFGAAVCCLLVAGYGGYLLTKDIPNVGHVENATITNAENTSMKNPYAWIPTALLLLLAFITHMGIRLLPWMLIGEIFNAKTRSGAAGLSSGIGYIFGFLSNKIYLNMVETLSIWGTYGLYGIVCLSGCVVLYFILPETEGKTLNEIENHFAGIRKLTNEVYRSKRITKPTSTDTATSNPAFTEDCSEL